jgi:hypothetical protein
MLVQHTQKEGIVKAFFCRLDFAALTPTYKEPCFATRSSVGSHLVFSYYISYYIDVGRSLTSRFFGEICIPIIHDKFFLTAMLRIPSTRQARVNDSFSVHFAVANV